MLSADISIAENLQRVEERLAEVAIRAGRRPEEITLIGISKTQPAERLAQAIQAGLRHVGENRVQEAAAKFPGVRQLIGQSANPVFHLVGHLQTNKAAQALTLFDRIDSIDGVKTAEALSKRLPAGRELSILVEVYVGDDPARPGARPAELVDVVGAILEVPLIAVQGLMTVATHGGEARAAFARVRALKETLAAAFPVVHFGVLSMGMSEDFEAAIEEGSTEIRLGTALFGPRRQQN
jgi:pyridoxal phosphate enzyme (YggS family)